MSDDIRRQDGEKEINDRKTGMICNDKIVGEDIYVEDRKWAMICIDRIETRNQWQEDRHDMQRQDSGGHIKEYHPSRSSSVNCLRVSSFQHFICELCTLYHPSSRLSVNCVWISSFQQFICELCMSIILPAVHLWTVLLCMNIILLAVHSVNCSPLWWSLFRCNLNFRPQSENPSHIIHIQLEISTLLT